MWAEPCTIKSNENNVLILTVYKVGCFLRPYHVHVGSFPRAGFPVMVTEESESVLLGSAILAATASGANVCHMIII